MLFGDDETCVVIADGRSGVRLTRLGKAGAMGFPAGIEVRAGPLSDAVREEALSIFSAFCR